VEIHGACPSRFAALKDAFAANFAENLELGAAFALAVEGEVVVDLRAGFTDRAKTRPWDARTLAPVFSTTKAIAALLMARAVGQDRIDYAQPVADLWPQFAAAGKAGITVEQCLSHQDGLAAFMDPIDPELWYDWDGLCAHLAAMAPLWPPGTASGYHPVTFGFIAGEIFRRADGRTMGQALTEDLAGPLGLDLWIGLPDAEHGRVADMHRPPGPPDFGELTPLKRAAFLEPWSSPSGRDIGRWRRAQFPSANGHATAPALARLMAALACDGRLDGVEVLAPGVAEAARRQRVLGPDLVLPFTLGWGAGFLRNQGLGVYGPGERTVGHSGWGGSCVLADPDRRLSCAYVMNRQSTSLIGDPRARRLIEAAYAGV
jgi:CubicO group peptidase (beta-lactamase class C family)